MMAKKAAPNEAQRKVWPGGVTIRARDGMVIMEPIKRGSIQAMRPSEAVALSIRLTEVSAEAMEQWKAKES